MDVSPTPTDEEMAAIAAAVQVAMRPPTVVAWADETQRLPAWRFSGRWWSRPVPVRRFRPWT